MAQDAKIIKIRVVGGEVPPAANIAPKLSPLGVNPKQTGEEIQKTTKEWKGIKILLELRIKDRKAEINVIPTATAHVIKALAEPPRDRKKVKNIKHNGNITFAKIKEIAKVMRFKSKAIEFTGTIKEILGTCVAVGCTVDKKSPKDIIEMVNNGELDVSEP